MAEDAATTLPASRTSGRTISKGKFMVLHDLTGATTPLHVNKHYMQGTAYGERILSDGVMISLLVAGWASSDLFCTLVADNRVEWTAALGIEGRLLKPLYPGDTLCIVHSIYDVRRVTNRPGEALTAAAHNLL